MDEVCGRRSARVREACLLCDGGPPRKWEENTPRTVIYYPIIIRCAVRRIIYSVDIPFCAGIRVLRVIIDHEIQMYCIM